MSEGLGMLKSILGFPILRSYHKSTTSYSYSKGAVV